MSETKNPSANQSSEVEETTEKKTNEENEIKEETEKIEETEEETESQSISEEPEETESLEEQQASKSNLVKKLDDFFTKLQGIPLSQKLFFTKNLGVMVKAGLSLSVAIKTLARQTPNKYLKKILLNAHKGVEKGETLSDSLSNYPKVFSEVFINMLKVGEKGGNLEKVLDELTLQMKKTHELTSKVKGALAYPAFILLAMVGIGVLMMIFVVPQVINIFEGINATLPLPTRILIKISGFITSNGILVALIFVASAAIVIKLIRTKTGRRYLHLIILKIPVISSIVKKINLAKFSRTFSSLLATDIPIIKTIQITGRVLGNTVYQNYVIASAEKIQKGQSVAKTLGENNSLFPPVITQMIEVGEQTGTLDNILEDLAEFYEEEVSNTMEGLASIIEPVLIIVLGLAVAGMAVSIIMPMYSLSQQF